MLKIACLILYFLAFDSGVIGEKVELIMKTSNIDKKSVIQKPSEEMSVK
tara:strand:- start:868 stop:1014 length:147 start_codon:yes stop_codon:yes gene_type:complete